MLPIPEDSSVTMRMAGEEGEDLNEPEVIDFRQWIPLFPLSNAVLLPRAVMPLHVFEPRYLAMMRDALTEPRLIALALLQSGYEPRYHTLDVPIHDVVCVGRILKGERLSDGRYNFLLQGLQRARVLEENRARSYRRAHLELLCSTPPDPDEEVAYLQQLQYLLSRPPLLPLIEEAHWPELFEGSAVGLSDLVDVLASAVLGGFEEKQAFLAEPRVELRARRLCDALRTLAEELITPEGINTAARNWPPACSDN